MPALPQTTPTEWVIAGVPVTLKRSARRRTVALQVQPGRVTLYAPMRVPLGKLHEVLISRQDWVAHHLAQYAQRPTSALQFTDGAALPFLGEILTLQFTAGRGVKREGSRLIIPGGSPAQVKVQVEAWTQAACLIPYRALIEEYADQLGARHKLGKVGISKAATRWGSCNSSGDIRLHWKLSRAPLPILRYVALHETAHLHELNHSPHYWALVQRHMPGWQAHRRWLQENGEML